MHSSSDTAYDSYRLPAEWETQQCVLLTWPHAGTDWAYCLDEITATFVALADAITRAEPLLIATPEPDHVKRLLGEALNGEQMSRVAYCLCPTDDTWARDHGFITLVSDDAEAPLRLLDFRFNGWGEKFPSEHDNAINRHLYGLGLLHGEYECHDDFVLEGGSIESDGRGTVFTTSTCLLAPHRNQPLTKDEIETQLKKRLHAQRIVWIDYGLLEGDDTDGHIDTIVRIAPDDTLLYVGCDDTDDPQYESFRLLEEQLCTFRTTDGQPYRLIRLPMPDALYEDGYRLPATYANFLIVNGAVIYPTYAQPAHDEEARTAIQAAFPQHRLIAIDARTIIRQHGSIHCLTMQVPEQVKAPTPSLPEERE